VSAGVSRHPGWVRPRHRDAGTALALGLIGLLAALPSFGLALLVSPFAWAKGQRTLRDIRSSGGWLDGEREARAGMVLGIIGTALLVLLVVLVVLLVLWLPGPVERLETRPEGVSV
jgi:hypothetical protein